MPRGVYERTTERRAQHRAAMMGNQNAVAHGMEGTRTYRSWDGMLQRCHNPRNPRYPDYGGRGITVCERWCSFANFYADMGERPEGTSIDRIDNDGNYELGNCRWATASEQQRNQRRRRS